MGSIQQWNLTIIKAHKPMNLLSGNSNSKLSVLGIYVI